MKIELKNIKYSSFASQETHCFEASVYVDGVKAGSAYNRGHGGATVIFPPELAQSIEAHAATLPEVTTSVDGSADPQKQFTYKPSAETLVDGLVTDWLMAKDLKRALCKRLVYTRFGHEGIFQSMPLSNLGAILSSGEANVRKQLAAQSPDKILNFMPPDEAFQLYRTAPGT